MIDEVINSDTLITYLTVSNRWNSAGFGGSNALHGQVLALLGEMVGLELPMLVKFVDDPVENLVHGLAMEEVCVPSNALVGAYFAGPAAVDLMPASSQCAPRWGEHEPVKCVPYPLGMGPILHGFQDSA
jgi:hypothetical protein